MTKVSVVVCPKCNWGIYSRARHDFRSCECGAVFVDGGFDYLRYGWSNDLDSTKVKVVTLCVKATKIQLYQDWNSTKGKYGMIPPKGKEVKKRKNPPKKT